LIGKKLGQYEIIESIGQGGMGEVYRARDSSLGRFVAVKFLPPMLAENPRAMQRLQREARMLASVAHPNVAAVHGLENVNGQTFIAMEYVEGEDLSTRLRNGPIPHDEAVEITVQVARGLEEAHRHGVIHRDLKPGNVRISESGTVKILDFGLAREAQDDPKEAGSDAMTIVASLTEKGEILGTPAYMSPEQARGERVDERTDLWALGLILHEMLTGQRAFAGRTAVDTLSLVLQRQPDFDSLRLVAPAETGRLVRQCLRKDRDKRMQSAGDLRVRLEDIAAGEHGIAGTPQSGSSWRKILTVALLVGVPIAVWFIKPDRDQTVPGSGHYEIPAPEGLRFFHRYQHGVDISPDGLTLAFAAGTTVTPGTPDSGTSHLYLRRLDNWEANRLEGTAGGSQPVFTPDGTALVFVHDHPLKRIPISGGEAQTLSESHAHNGVSFLPDGSLVIGRFAAGLGLLSRAGGSIDTLALPDRQAGEYLFDLPHALPDGRAILFTCRDLATAMDYEQSARVKVLALETGEQKTLLPGATDARYVESGHLVYAKEGSLYAIGFDIDRLETVGSEIRVVERVSHSIHAASTARETGAAQFAVSPTGTLVYLPGSIFPERIRELVWISRNGSREAIPVDPMQYHLARLSPDDRRILLSTNYPPRDVWTYEIERGSMRRQTFDGNYHSAIWGPGADRFTAAANRDRDVAILTRAVDASGVAPTRLDLDQRYWPIQWIDEDSALLATAWRGSVIHTIREDGAEDPVFDQPVRGGASSLSPDNQWLLYSARESGESHVYVRRWPDSETAYQVSVSGGYSPMWSTDGREVFYWQWSDELDQFAAYAVAFSASGPRPTLGSPTRLFGAPVSLLFQHRSWDIGPDGRFLVVLSHTDSLDAEIGRKVFPDRMRIATGWLNELEEKLGQ